MTVPSADDHRSTIIICRVHTCMCALVLPKNLLSVKLHCSDYDMYTVCIVCCVYMYMQYYSSYMTLIGVHEMHGRVHPN